MGGYGGDAPAKRLAREMKLGGSRFPQIGIWRRELSQQNPSEATDK